YAGLLWTAEHAQDLGIDLTQISVAGVSAGGGLAAATALMARDRDGPKLQGQLLVCPMLDDRDQTLSTLQYADIGTWNRQSNQVGWTALLGSKRIGIEQPFFDTASHIIILFGNVAFNLIPLCSSASCRQAA
ncbi:unnamed protein product, partial [Rotaria socialis]